ncbi:hypothetical protein [Microbacterium sp. 179-I 3D3 NHS]|uniref:hypothetical protein n=1 Tax=Microbacterium sp. 179-I 3D3 NHS TaxID=3142382 RepID=UPI0039A0C857
MRRYVGVVALGVGAVVVAACSGCSTDALVWGSEGAAVRSVAEQVIDDMQSSGSSSKLCADAALEVGSSEVWETMAPGEPEKYTGEESKDYTDASPTWFINLSPTDDATSGSEVPNFLFLRGSGEDLCVVAIEWGELSTSP